MSGKPARTVGARMEIAASAAAATGALVELATDPSEAVRAAVALNARTPESALVDLAGDPRPKVRLAVAHNDAAAPRVLDRLLDDPNVKIRCGTAEHARLTHEQKARLAQDPDKWVRGYIAARPDVPLQVARMLAADRERYVREVLASWTPWRTIIDLLAGDAHQHVRGSAAVNRRLSEPQVRRLAKDRSAVVRSALLMSHAYDGIPDDVLDELARDPAPSVREAFPMIPDPPQWLREIISQDPDDDIRAAAAWWADPPPPLPTIASVSVEPRATAGGDQRS